METEKSKPIPKWAGFKYEQVPGLANRIIARYLRGQRRNMERFFTERGLHDSAERMRQIRLSRQGMTAKNRMFQECLNEYARRASPQPAVAQAEDHQAEGSARVGLPGDRVPDGVGDAAVPVREAGEVPAGSVPAVAGLDDAELVIEE